MTSQYFERRRLRFRLPLALGSGALLSLAFPPADVRWVAFVALVPLLLALRGASGRAGALLGAAFGASFFGLLLLWISLVGWIAWGALVFLQALFAVAFGLTGAWLARGGVIGRLVGWPLLFTGAEIARAHWPLGGFAWGSLGASQHSGLPLLPLARAGGMWSVTLALVLLNALVAEAVARPGRIRRSLALVAAAAVAIGPAFLPLRAAGATGETLDVAVVQGNVPEGHFTDLVRGRVGPEDEVILRNHAALSKTLEPLPPDLAIWPENAIDRDPFNNAEVGEELAAAVAGIGRPVLVGAILDAPDGRYANTNLLFAGDGRTLMGRYDKTHLVPFGEYVPWDWARRVVSELDQIPFDGVPGRAARVLRTGSARIGAVICFESAYPDLVRRFVRNGAEILVVSTNNATFRRSPLARQHLAQSRMRAVEQGRTVVHAAISGISAIITPDGTIRAEAGLFRPAVLRADVPLAAGLTPYARHGSTIDRSIGLGGAAAAALALVLAAFRRRRPVVRAGEPEPDGDEEFWSPPSSDASPPPLPDSPPEESPATTVESP